jgi:hypothetical protein
MEYNWDKVLRVVSMKRGGHHAVIEWIAENMNGNVYFINNVNNPILKNNYSKIIKYKSSKENKNILLYNIEDFDPNNNIKLPLEQETILVIRDPLNLFASRCKLLKEKEHKNKPWFNDVMLNRYKKHFNLMSDSDYFTIIYNKWYKSDIYRKKIGEKLSLNESCFNPLNKLATIGKNNKTIKQ